MNDQFFSRDPAVAKQEIVERLYDRLKEVKERRDNFQYFVMSNWDRGHLNGVHEEIEFLEKLLDSIERS